MLFGDWGRVIFGFGPRHSCFYREYLLEKVRKQEFPDKPSRMKAIFAFEDFNFASTWRRGDTPEYVYAVKLADPASLTHRGDMSWIDLMNSYHSFESVEDCARKYWRGDERDPKAMEVAVTGDFIVEDILLIPNDGKI